MSTAVEAEIKVTLVTWYEIYRCDKIPNANGELSIVHEVIGYLPAFEAARAYGESQGWEYVPHESYSRFVKRAGAGGTAFLVIPQYVVLTSPCGARGYLAGKYPRADVELLT
jgi:hypothetical protein